MLTVPERIAKLREAMRAASVDAYIMPSSDPHASEYAPAHYTSWEYFSGFSVENSKLIVTASEAALWVDGRFFGAADAALKNTGIASMHMGVLGVPTAYEWLSNKLATGSVLGYTAENMSLGEYRALKRCADKAGIVLKACHADDDAWTEDRPALPATEAWILDKQYCGMDTAEKLAAFRAKLPCDAAVITGLDSVAWILNLRAFDVGNTPYALAFLYVKKDGAVLFIDESRVPDAVRAELSRCGVVMQPYDGVPAYLAEISEPVGVLVDPVRINAALYTILSENPAVTLTEQEDPAVMLKAVKSETELANTRAAHIMDGAAMVRFQMELEQRLAAGETLRETDIDPILHKYRSSAPLFIEESFGTIAAYGPNAAMMHYAPVVGSDAEILRKGFLLVDCGGTYYNGTTDITRTYTMGPLTEEERVDYTLVLRCHIDMAMAVWKEGMKGGQLDMLARQPLWHRMLDYRCGTGHSVGHVAAVHEGPHSLRYTNEVPFVPGMIITDEPGIYEDGKVGIRIENELVCVEAGISEYGRFLKFEPVMYVPINLTPVIPEMLSGEEKEWLNWYHAQVVEKLSPVLNAEEQAWLREKCAPID